MSTDTPRDYPALPPLGGWFTDEEVQAVMETLRDSMDWRTGFGGPEIGQFEAAFAAYCGVEHAIAVNSCGSGLDLAMMCLGLQPGDEVISPAITFKATHQAIVGQGGTVVMCEIDPATFNVDVADVERRLTPRTRAILAVHNNGLSVFMGELEAVAAAHPHPTYGPPKAIGDAARACGAGYKGAKVGKMGWMNVFSFQTSKNMTTLGEGGMITTDDPEVARRARAHRSFGAGDMFWGTNYRMIRLQGAVGLVQLRRLDLICYLLGEPQRVCGLTDHRVMDYAVPDTESLLCRMADGTHVACSCYWNMPLSADEMEIHGTEGSLLATPFDANTLVVRTRGGEETLDVTRPFANVHLPLIASFAARVGAGQPPEFDGTDGMQATRIIDGCYRSHASGQWETV